MRNARYPSTPDGRYFVVKGKLWRCTKPDLDPEDKTSLVSELMSARRAVKIAKAQDAQDAIKSARAQIQLAKVALGERGPVWWTDGSPDFNQHKVASTPYASWFSSLLQETSDQD